MKGDLYSTNRFSSQSKSFIISSIFGETHVSRSLLHRNHQINMIFKQVNFLFNIMMHIYKIYSSYMHVCSTFSSPLPVSFYVPVLLGGGIAILNTTIATTAIIATAKAMIVTIADGNGKSACSMPSNVISGPAAARFQLGK